MGWENEITLEMHYIHALIMFGVTGDAERLRILMYYEYGR